MPSIIRRTIFIFIFSIFIILTACSNTKINKVDVNTPESSIQKPKDNKISIQGEKTDLGNDNFLFNSLPKEVNKNILIVGIDARKNENARADAMILVNMRNDKINFISIPRDTLIKINGKDIQKINASYAYGGIELCRSSIEKLLDTKIDNYLVFNFKAIQKGVDALGGFTVAIPEAINIRDLELNKHFALKKGSHKLNGIQTLEYLRYRNDGKGDIGRIYRQQEFIKDLQSSFLKLENIPLIPKAYLTIRDEIKTDMDATHMISYFISGYRLRNNFEYHTLKGYGKSIDKVSYYVLYKSSINEVKSILK